ncbi:hypothetical protein A2572_02455 [Candidatus Collierbacteria bacterium RIFOXYD1_FULL_40_9]|uniref:Uncharacterized protein n=1 Tax=Candidatus Collierbacteria bacterium RIFOXYD1_FULL_40_9 TaxID=1817731 RepID=A0A1F5FPD0_9BACT|nr:MAG: hypothetical protein A2572_02455 [Candidatus Collierbacteria bacterium RIFOXYD1_FULL_40_9]
MTKSYFCSLLQIVHTLEKSGKLSFDERSNLEKQINRLSHFLDTKDVKKAKIQVGRVSSLILEILKR